MGAFVELETTTLAPQKQKTFRFFIYTIETVSIMLSLFFTPVTVLAKEHAEKPLPNFSTFVENIRDGKTDVLEGVYVPDVFALPVVQQPVGDPGYVSQAADTVTQFEMAAEVGNVGLLAHNNLAGQEFTNLSLRDEVRLVYGDGKVEYFIVTQMLRYQALQPYSPYSEFRDLETSKTITAEELFRKVYRGDRHVTFQVCIAANGIDAWGRLFIIAQPKSVAFTEQQYLRWNLIRRFIQ
jgi:hypothetical protein